jgi:SAM-dependent methyltransferase
LVDIGCGDNQLVRAYGSGLGVDVHDWGDVDILVQDASRLPISDASAETVTFVACLNHIANREAVLREAHRILSPGGRIVVTMIPPMLSRIWHAVIRPLDRDQTERHDHDGEVWGLRSAEVRELMARAGFRLTMSKRFRFFLNHLYVGIRE